MMHTSGKRDKMTRDCNPKISCAAGKREKIIKKPSLTRGSEDPRVCLQSVFLSPPTSALPEVRKRHGQFYLFLIYNDVPRPK